MAGTHGGGATTDPSYEELIRKDLPLERFGGWGKNLNPAQVHELAFGLPHGAVNGTIEVNDSHPLRALKIFQVYVLQLHCMPFRNENLSSRHSFCIMPVSAYLMRDNFETYHLKLNYKIIHNALYYCIIYHFRNFSLLALQMQCKNILYL